MASLKFRLGLIPKTSKIEAIEASLQSEFDEFVAFGESKELKRFKELEDFINSVQFPRIKKEIRSQRFKDSEVYRTIQDYKDIKNSPTIKAYLKARLSDSGADKSDGTVKKFLALEKEINSPEFQEKEAYQKLSGSKKWMKSDEYKMLQEYQRFKKSEKMKWYNKMLKSSKFHSLRKWDKTFEDNFEQNSLDKNKWITKFLWGEKFLKDGYSIGSDKHFLTDGKNIEIKNGVLRIITRQEEITGQAWDPNIGFYPKDFKYTSGLISTGNNFKQKYGLFKAKVRIDRPGSVSHAFWMLSEKILPHIDIFKTQKNKILLNYFYPKNSGNGFAKSSSKVGSGKLSNDFYIFSLEWTPNRLVWKINGLTVAVQKGNVPDQPMYVNFSSGIYTDSVNGTLPVSLDIDWVRVYQSAAS